MSYISQVSVCHQVSGVVSLYPQAVFGDGILCLKASSRLVIKTFSVLPEGFNSVERQAHPKLRNRLLLRLCGQQKNFPAQPVGSLAVVWRTDLQQYQLFIWESRSPLSSLLFATYIHCYESAIELEQQFELNGALRLRPFGSMEAMDEIIQSHQLRERVALAEV